MKSKSVVYPIPPSFVNGGKNLDVESLARYLDYLHENGVKRVMSTAGTSQFNIMSLGEIQEFNQFICKSKIESKIIGVPQLSLNETIEFANETSNYSDEPVIILFPERFYNEKLIVDFFATCAREIVKPVYIHGMWMRAGNGGTWDFNSSVINQLCQIENIAGMKEETSEIGKAFNILSSVKSPDFDIILAGGSQRRHWFLSAARECSFLSGIGSLFPRVDENYMNTFLDGNLNEAKSMIEEYETPLFDVFMSIGWHYSMRHGLKKLGYIQDNRNPFPDTLGQDADRKIESILQNLSAKISK